MFYDRLWVKSSYNFPKMRSWSTLNKELRSCQVVYFWLATTCGTIGLLPFFGALELVTSFSETCLSCGKVLFLYLFWSDLALLELYCYRYILLGCHSQHELPLSVFRRGDSGPCSVCMGVRSDDKLCRDLQGWCRQSPLSVFRRLYLFFYTLIETSVCCTTLYVF